MKKFLGIFFIFSFILLSTAPIHASNSRPITFEDFIRIQRLSDPRVSPQGDMIAFVVTSMDLETNTSNSDIWIQSLKGGEPWSSLQVPNLISIPGGRLMGKRSHLSPHEMGFLKFG